MSTQFAALASQPYRRYWLGSVASVGGLQLLMMGQNWLVFDLTHSPIALGYLGAASSVPNILVVLFGGALADRLDKRLVLRNVALLNSALMLLLAVLAWSGVIEVWHVLVIAAVQSLVSGLDWPTRSAFYPLLIAREHMMSAVALNSIVWQSSRMIVPAIGGVLLSATSPWVLFLLAGLGMLYMAFVVHGLRVETASRAVIGSALQHTLEGIRFIAGNRLFLLLMLLAFVLMFFGTSYIQFMPAFADMLGADSRGFGILMSATGVGSVLGTFMAAYVQRDQRSGSIMLLCAGAFTPCIVLFALVCQFADQLPAAFVLALGCALAASAISSIYNIVSMTIMQLQVPDELRGRVMGIHGISFSFMTLGALVTGAIAQFIGTPVATIISASVVLAVVLWLAVSQPILRVRAHALA